MKNITLAVDDDTWRRARIAAAERGTSVSAMVRSYLTSLARPAPTGADPTDALFAALDQAGPFRAADRLDREDAHARRPA
jgi:plasmid stability protein